MAQVVALRDQFERALIDRVSTVRILGETADRLPNTSAFVVPGLDADATVEALAKQGVIIATGSACSSGSPAPSHVLLAMGLDYEAAKSTLRVSLSRDTAKDELELLLDGLSRLVHLTA